MGTGSNIRKLRLLAGMTLEKLSELSGVDTGTISALELRDSERSKFFQPIAMAMGISTDQLSSEITTQQIEHAEMLKRMAQGDSPSEWLNHKEIIESVFDKVNEGVNTQRKISHIEPKKNSQRQKDIDKIVELLNATRDDGIALILGATIQVAKERPLNRKQAK